MSAQENKQVIRRLYEMVYQETSRGNKISESKVREFVDDETLIQHFLASQEAFPYYWIEPEELIAEGEMVAVRGWMRGKHLGPFMGHPPTGREIKVPMFITYRIVGGKVVDHWMTFDSAILFRQLGIPLPEEEAVL
jgi:predicted ester cyclase